MERAGDIVMVDFPFDEGGSKHRPALVLEVTESLVGERFLHVAYGTSRKVSPGALLDGEFIITKQMGSAFRASGLPKDTKFVLTLTANVAASKATTVGCIHAVLMRDFAKAAKQAGLC